MHDDGTWNRSLICVNSREMLNVVLVMVVNHLADITGKI
jgi:hypothetical protein